MAGPPEGGPYRVKAVATGGPMHIETLQTFCSLVETGSFTKAARLGFISQSAVSQQLKALEARYGQPLIERGAGRTLAPTAAGRLLYAECRELLDRFGRLEGLLREPATAVAGTVRLATVYSIGLHELPPYVTRFMQAHPRVKVHVEYSRTDKVCDACVNGTVDFGIVAFPLRRTNLAVIPWHEEKLVLACAPSHRLARRRAVRLAELRGEPFIAFERDIPTRKTIDRVLRAQRVAVDIMMEFDNVETIKRSVEVGTGLSILPASTVAREARSGMLTTSDFADGPFTREVGLIHRRGRVLSAPAQAFVQLLLGSGTPKRGRLIRQAHKRGPTSARVRSEGANR